MIMLHNNILNANVNFLKLKVNLKKSLIRRVILKPKRSRAIVYCCKQLYIWNNLWQYPIKAPVSGERLYSKYFFYTA